MPPSRARAPVPQVDVRAAAAQARPPKRDIREAFASRPTRREAELFERYHEHGDLEARDELVDRFLPLARRLAQRYQRRLEPIDDLVQVASIGLIKAIERFDPSRGHAFSSFAVPTISGELKRHFRDCGWAVHVPRGVQERVIDVNRAVERLARELRRSPSAAEIAGSLGLTTEEVLEAMEAALAYDAVLLEPPRGRDPDDAGPGVEALGEDDGGYELVDYRSALAAALRTLPPRERVVLHLRFFEDMTQAQIGERIGISQMHVSRLARRALTRLQVVAEGQEEPRSAAGMARARPEDRAVA